MPSAPLQPQRKELLDQPARPPAAKAPALPQAPAPSVSSFSASSVLALQRSAGNAAVNTMMQRATVARCAGGDCHCEECESKHAQGVEGHAEEDLLTGEGPAPDEAPAPALDEAEAATATAQTVAGKPEEEIFTGEGPAPIDAAGPAGAAPDAGGGAAPGEPEQLLQQAIAATGRARKLMRAASFTAGPVHEVNNLVDCVINGAPAGLTWMTLNGTKLTTSAVAHGAIAKPTVKTTAVPAGGFDAEVDAIPANTGSFDETVLAAGPWKLLVSRGAVAAEFPTLAQCASSGDTTFQAFGDPSDAAMFAANRRHEDHHASDHKTQFDASVKAWDTKVTAAKTSGKKFHGATAADAEAALWAAMGGTPDQIADKYRNDCLAAGAAFHTTPKGGPISAGHDPQASADCSTSSAKYTNPS